MMSRYMDYDWKHFGKCTTRRWFSVWAYGRRTDRNSSHRWRHHHSTGLPHCMHGERSRRRVARYALKNMQESQSIAQISRSRLVSSVFTL